VPSLFALTTAAAAALQRDQAPGWMRGLARDPAEEGPRALHLASRALVVAVAALTQARLVVAIVATPQ
jgi:hypothetical protein